MRDQRDTAFLKQTSLPDVPLLHEMLKSFVTLADTLNLSEAVRRTGVTRQTLRRHIATLETLRGESLFTLDDRRYVLSDAGRRALDGAIDILVRGDAWVANMSSHVEGLIHLSGRSDLGVEYHLQHHALGKLWQTGEPLLQVAFKLWAQSMGQIEDPKFQAVRPYIIVFRKVSGAWICVEIGEQSSYTSWYGREWAQSTVGLRADSLPAGRGFARLLSTPFDDIEITESARYDHVSTEMIRVKSGPLANISFQRLLLSIRFPDGSKGIVSVVERTRNILIAGLDRALIDKMQPELVMNSLSDTL